MKVTRQPSDPGVTGWNAILPPQRNYPCLEDDQTADWVVIGAGFAGLSAARRLHQLHPKARIVVLEARRIAEGPAGRNSGFMIDLPHNLTSEDYGSGLEIDRKHTRHNRKAIEFAANVAEEFQLGEEAFARTGKINGAASQKGLDHNRTYSKHLELLGEEHELLDAGQMQSITGTDYYHGGLFTPGVAMIQPALYVRGLADGLSQTGVFIFEQSGVTGMEKQGSDWRVRTAGGSVAAPRVILAVNGHVESFGHFQRRLIHIYLYASMTRALTSDEVKELGGDPRWGITPSDPIGSTVRRISGTGGDRIIVRNRVTYNPGRVPPKSIESFVRTHEASFVARFPMLKNVEMEYSWGGQLCLSRNSVPAFGEVAEGVYSACCQNGLGTAKGTLSGILAAELASGTHSDTLNEVLAEPQASKLPPEPFCWIGATATMRWGEFRAGREL